MSPTFLIDTFQTPDGIAIRYGVIRDTYRTEPVKCPLVYVPGLGGSVKYALPLLKRLAARYGAVYSLDGRGVGINVDIEPQMFPSRYNQDLDHFVAHLLRTRQIEATSAPVILGLSLGGVLVTNYLVQYPEHPFKAAVLFAPAFMPHKSRFTWAYRLKNYGTLFTKGLMARCFVPYGPSDLTRNTQAWNDPPYSDPVPIPIVYLHFVEALCRKGLNLTSRINVPAAVIVPECDTICDPETMRKAYERIPHPQKALFSYPNLYHDVMQEPDEDLALIEKDLDGWLKATLALKDTIALPI